MPALTCERKLGCKLSVGLVMDATFYIHFLMGSNRWREQEIIINESGEEKKDFCITGLDWIGKVVFI